MAMAIEIGDEIDRRRFVRRAISTVGRVHLRGDLIRGDQDHAYIPAVSQQKFGWDLILELVCETGPA